MSSLPPLQLLRALILSPAECTTRQVHLMHAREVGFAHLPLYQSDWNEESVKLVQEQGEKSDMFSRYRASKTLAERAAWKFVKHNTGLSFDLATVLPAHVIGPLLIKVTGWRTDTKRAATVDCSRLDTESYGRVAERLVQGDPSSLQRS